MEACCKSGKMIIISAPSGAGKTTLVTRLLRRFSCFAFSVSATSRAPRGTEQTGIDYHFLTAEEFDAAVQRSEFVEWEEVYPGTCYGTLHSELDRLWREGKTIIFDVDVRGGIRLKEIFGAQALSVFIMPPSIDELRRRLVARGTDAPETIGKRVDKAEQEISLSSRFDRIVVNDNLEEAYPQLEAIILEFMHR